MSAAMLMLSPAVAAPDWRLGGSGSGSELARATWKSSAEDHPLHVLSPVSISFFFFFAAGSKPKLVTAAATQTSWALHTPPHSPSPLLTHADMWKEHLWARCVQETRCCSHDISIIIISIIISSSSSTTDRGSWLRACSPIGTIVHEPKHRCERPLLSLINMHTQSWLRLRIHPRDYQPSVSLL